MSIAEELEYQVIESAESLQGCIAVIEQTSVVALDTEADSLHHYYPKVCLIQISANGLNFIIDPLAGFGLTPLLDALRTKRLLLHGADYDLRMLRASYDFAPEGEVFDTMLAAQLLGYEPFGLGALVERHFAVVLPKDGQKWDWSRRPLEPRQFAYAANDTRYLEEMVGMIEAELTKLGRLEWHRENCQRMVHAALTATPKEKSADEVWRIKGSNRLPKDAQVFLRALWEWREGQAQSADLPPFKVLNNQFLLDICTWLVENPERTLEEYDKLPRNVRGKRLSDLQQILTIALNAPRPVRQERSEPRRKIIPWTPEDEQTLAELQKARDVIATELNLTPSVLAPRSVMQDVVRERLRSKLELAEKTRLTHWQIDLLEPVWTPLLG
ncbi:TPA: hypothetical protein DDW35_13460 [Candidatus Sumerlaeota bacterium]|jgi:ribonuclease D|nr:hypothetical protein [Candidatus Sumerlaeota bacterium]